MGGATFLAEFGSVAPIFQSETESNFMTNLPHILNWRRYNDRITTSGQPSEDELAEIQRTGVRHIINLGPHHNDGALPDERKTVTDFGDGIHLYPR